MKKTLSISVAAYNVAATLEETLNAFVQSKVLEDLDIIVVDDGSKDNTAEIALKYVKMFPGSFRLIKKENGGWGSTVNKGIEEAQGKYFRQVDGDDYYNPVNMSKYIEALKKSNADMVITPYITYDDVSGEIVSHENCNPGCQVGIEYNLEDVKSFSPFMHSIAVKTECIRNKVNITEKCFYTDTEFVLKSCNQVKTIEFLDMEIYCYRRGTTGQSMSLSGMEKHYLDQFKVIDTLLDYKKDEVNSEAVSNIFNSLLLGTCCWQYLVMLYLNPTSKHKKDLIEYDKMLKKKAPDYYNNIGVKEVDFLRFTHFIGYSLVAKYKKRKDNRFTDDGRLVS